MKILFITSLLLSFNTFAIDFNKVTGSFDVASENKFEQVAHVTTITGSYEGEQIESNGRMPASSPEKQKSEQIQEVTGSFR